MQPSLSNLSFAAARAAAVSNANYSAAELLAGRQCWQDNQRKTEGAVWSEVSWERIWQCFAGLGHVGIYCCC